METTGSMSSGYEAHFTAGGYLDLIIKRVLSNLRALHTRLISLRQDYREVVVKPSEIIVVMMHTPDGAFY